jgi:rhodanese-related sulfurtransferase
LSGISKIITVLVLMLSLAIVTSGCNRGIIASSTVNSSQSPGSSISPVVNKVIDVQTAHQMIENNNDNPDFIILDVRTAGEFATGYIEDAIMIDFNSPDFKAKIDKLNRDKKYLVYCRSGNRSSQAVKIMLDLGFEDVYEMIGGITQWVAKGYPTVMD